MQINTINLNQKSQTGGQETRYGLYKCFMGIALYFLEIEITFNS